MLRTACPARVLSARRVASRPDPVLPYRPTSGYPRSQTRRPCRSYRNRYPGDCRLRKLFSAILALPVLALAYVSWGMHRPKGRRVAVALILAMAVGVGASGLRTPTGIIANPPSTTAPVLDAALATTIQTGSTPDAAITLRFPGPMNRTSVTRLLEVEPATAVQLSWAAGDTELVVRPAQGWAPGTLHTLTIDAGALDATGRPIASQIRAAFLTRDATRATITPGQVAGQRVAVGTSLLIEFDRAIDEETLELVSDPPIDGTIERVTEGGEGYQYRFTPSDPLVPNFLYTVTLSQGVRDAEGGLVATGQPLVIQTANVPSVVRFRPRTKTVDVALDVAISVRFTEAMDQASTRAGWAVTADGAAVDGAITFAEGDTVLVFKLAADLGYGQTVVMTVGAGATSKAGLAVGTPISGTFTTVPQPAPRPTLGPTQAAATPRSSSGSTGGGAVGSGSWVGVETYYLGLMNCTRTGGTVSSTGTCSGGGSNGTAPLWIDAGITSAVARPYAKLLAVNNQCSHFINGDPGDRLSAAGYTSYIWAENLGCRSGDPYAAVLGSHLYFQSEKSYNGGHYVNLMNAKYDRVGLGVWVASGRVRLVVDFYHPR